MSRLCAKPTCSETAVSWLDILREDRRVLERSKESSHGLALCGTHRERFVVPAGWELKTSGDNATALVESKDTAPVAEAEVVFPAVSQERSTSRERPWFLAETAIDTPVRPLLIADDTVDHEPLTNGSLLRRAFHGPDRDDDEARRANARTDLEPTELETTDVEPADDDARYVRETERAMRSLDECGTAQLPFPSADVDVQAAVS